MMVVLKNEAQIHDQLKSLNRVLEIFEDLKYKDHKLFIKGQIKALRWVLGKEEEEMSDEEFIKLLKREGWMD